MFHDAMSLADDTKPLVVVLDSLDQLDSSDNGRLLSWMPPKLPPHVKMIVSTLPDNHYECLQKMQVCLAFHHELGSQRPFYPTFSSIIRGIIGSWVHILEVMIFASVSGAGSQYLHKSPNSTYNPSRLKHWMIAVNNFCPTGDRSFPGHVRPSGQTA